MPTRNLPPQTGAGSARDIYGEFGVDGGYSNAGATDIVNPRPKGIWEHLDLMWTGLVGKRSTGRSVDPDEMTLAASRTVTIAGAIALTDERKLIVFNSATPITVTLPTLASAGDGFEFQVLNIGAGTVTLDPDGSEQIAGAATAVLSTGLTWIIKASGATLGWRVLGRDAIGRVPGVTSSGQGLVQWDASGRIIGLVTSTASIPRALMPPGIAIANNATDLVNDIDVGALAVRSDDDTADLVLTSTWTKRLDATFAEGNNDGGRAAADNLTGAKWFHVWAIGGSGKTTQPFFSTSLTPTLPTGFTLKRRLWSIWWSGSAIERFTKVGLRCQFRTWRTDVASVTPIASRTLFALTVPPVAGVIAHIQAYMTSTVGFVASPDEADVAPSAVVNGTWNISYDYAVGSSGSFALDVPTNASQQIAHRAAAASGTWGVQTRGYTDTLL